MKLHKQSVLDALWALFGGILGGAAVGAVTIHRYLSTPVNTEPPKAAK